MQFDLEKVARVSYESFITAMTGAPKVPWGDLYEEQRHPWRISSLAAMNEYLAQWLAEKSTVNAQPREWVKNAR